MTRPYVNELLKSARSSGHAVGAFNAINLETAQAIVRAAELENTAVILQISENAARYAGLEMLGAIGCKLRDHATVPVVLHYDHAESSASAKQALDLGFDAVMLETAHLPFDRAVAHLREMAFFAHARGAVLEAEAEVTQKGTRTQENALSIKEVTRFAKDSQCDWLAVNIGSEHKQTQKRAHLDLDRLKAVAEATELPLVLHGASGISEETLKAAIGLGISKVNVATELMLSFTTGVRKALQDADLYDPRRYLGHAREAMLERTRSLIKMISAPINS